MNRFQWGIVIGVFALVVYGVMQMVGGTVEDSKLVEAPIAEVINPVIDIDVKDEVADIWVEEEPLIPEPLGVLHGTVLNAHNYPVTHAQITVVGKIEVSTQSDAQGNFRLPDLPRGKYQVTIEHPWFPVFEQTVTIRRKLTRKFSLDYYTLKGTVVNAVNQQAVEKFTLVKSKVGEPEDQKTTGVCLHGRFELPCRYGLYQTMVIRAPGYEEKTIATKTFDKTGTVLTGDIELVPKSGAVSGKVVDTQGNPIAGAWVFLDRRQVVSENLSAAKTITDRDGHFWLDPIESEQKYIVANHPEYSPAYALYEKGHRYRSLELILEKGSSLSGTVRHGERPLSNQKINIHYFGDEPYGDWSVKSDEEGRYRISGLPPGECTVVCTISKEEESEEAFRTMRLDSILALAEGEDILLDFEVPEDTGTLEVIVPDGDDQDTLEGGLFWMKEEGRNVRFEHGFEKGGVSRFEHLLAGKWELMYGYENGSSMSISTVPFEIFPEETTVLELNEQRATGVVSGNVYSGEVAQGYMIFLFSRLLSAEDIDVQKLMSAMFQEKILPEKLAGLHFNMNIFGGGAQHKALTEYSLFDVPAGRYTLIAVGGTDSNDMPDFSDWPIVAQEFSIKDGEHVELDVEF